MINRKSSKPHKKKVQTIALSILLSVIVWFMVTSLADPDITTTVSNLDVRFVGEMALREKALAVTGRNNVPQLSVVVTGKRSDLMNNMDNIYVQVDLSDIDSTGEYNLAGTISVPTTRIKVEKEKYGDIPVKIEPLVSKEIDVTVKQTGTLKNKLVKSVVNNPKVMIMGAESEMEKVERAVATVDISELAEDNTEKVNYLLTDKSGALIDENETLESARSNVEVSNTIYDAKTLPVEPMLTAEMDKEYMLKPDKSSVTPASVVVGVNVENNDDKVIARIDRINEDGEGEYSLETSNGMYIPPESQKVKIKPEIVKKSVVQLELEVHAENVPEGCSAKIDGLLTAMVWGEEGQVNNENVKATVDASGLSKGEHTLPVKLSGENAGFEGSYTINITIE
ncbi:MAG: CdaR family protein [Clostridia bacterium]|nr:CdaR family protein [Clostridia bacterium]